MKRQPSWGFLAGHTATRVAQRSWNQIRKIHPYRMQQIIISIFFVVVLTIGIRSGVKSFLRRQKCRPRPTDDALGYSEPAYPISTAYQHSKKLKRPKDSCVETLNFPQVALLVLTKGDVPHDTMWREWFGQAVGKLPRKAVQSYLGCPNTKQGSSASSSSVLHPQWTFPLSKFKELGKVCGQDVGAIDILAQQHLFDVWVHPSIDFAGFSPNSVFYRRDIPPEYRVRTIWGTHTIIDASRALLAAALTNPRNQKFILLSESDIPLYSPMTLYHQLISEPKSRVNACNMNNTDSPQRWDHNDGYRLRDDMIAEGLIPLYWRKSWQWVALNRKHAELAVNDIVVDASFRATCRRRWDPDWCDYRVCYSDEHYFPTLLAMKGLENETDCYGELTDRDWSRVKPTDPHPWEYRPDEVNKKLFESLRKPERSGCGHVDVMERIHRSHFIDRWQSLKMERLRHSGGSVMVLEEAICADPVVEHTRSPTATNTATTNNTTAATKILDLIGKDLHTSHNATIETSSNSTTTRSLLLLGPNCPLLARKFLNSTVDSVLFALLPCEDGLGILNDGIHCTNTTDSNPRYMEQLALLRRAERAVQRGLEDGNHHLHHDHNVSVMSRQQQQNDSAVILPLDNENLKSNQTPVYFIYYRYLALIPLLVLIIFVLAWTIGKTRRRARRLPMTMTHSQSFHTQLKHYGALE